MDTSNIDFSNLENNSLQELQQFAKEDLHIRSVTTYRKKALIELIEQALRSESQRQNNDSESAPENTEYRNQYNSVPEEQTIREKLYSNPQSTPYPGIPQRRNTYQRQPQPYKTESYDPQNRTEQAETVTKADGILEIMPDGFGFLRAQNCYTSEKDVYVSANFIKRAGLRTGDHIIGLSHVIRATEKFPSLFQIDIINGRRLDECRKRPHFDSLTPVYPDSRITLETSDSELSTRIIDLISPIGKGQRGLIVSPPKAGKTTLLKQIANAITKNHPDIKLIILLIDERPEEVTDIQRSTNANVIFSTFDEHPEHHAKVSEMILEHGKRLVESGDDVVILLDSITRLARSYNLIVPASGRALSGGLDPSALFRPKKFFGAARNIENGGSLTIIATALVETGSKMDDVIFEEFKGTGNMEIHLNRKLSERRIFPAVDLNKSGTRRDDMLLSKAEYNAMEVMRRNLAEGKTDKVTEFIISSLTKTKNNAQFVSVLDESLSQIDKVSSLDDDAILNNVFGY